MKERAASFKRDGKRKREERTRREPVRAKSEMDSASYFI